MFRFLNLTNTSLPTADSSAGECNLNINEYVEVTRQAREFLTTDHEDSWSPTWNRRLGAYGR